MQSQANSAYQQREILDADAPRLIILLYRGAIDAVALARAAQTRGEIRERSRQITRAFEIVAELANSIDREKGAELALRLLQLYDYIEQQLTRANAEQAVEPLNEVEGLLRALLEAWEAARTQLHAPVVSNPGVYSQLDRKPLSCTA